MKKRVLFVDDEPLVLQGLQRLLRPMRQEWEMDFAEGGSQALERLGTAAYDVIVSDMMMPGMNGAQLLEQVRNEWPKTIRIVLSGHTDKHLALQCVGVAHQFLSKPCDAQHLRNTIARVTDIGFAVQSEKLMNIVGRLDRLPSLPAIYSRLVTLLDNPVTSTQAIGALISRDIALTAHLLKIVNSAFFGLAQRVDQPCEAVAYLGMDTLKAVVLTAGIFEQWSVDPASGFCMETAAEHGQKVASAARLIAETEGASRAVADECFIAGLLHDVGKLVLACNLPDRFVPLAAVEKSDLLADEIENFGTTHAEIGGYLLGLWGLPTAVVESARLHHTPAESHVRNFNSLTAVHVANHFVRHASDNQPGGSLDQTWLASLDLAERVPIWRAAAEQRMPFNLPTACTV